MKVYKIEMLVVDFDQLGESAIIETIETTRYPNHCIAPSVHAIECRDIGPWDDNHPLNNKSKADAEYARLFAPAAQPVVLSEDRIIELWDAQRQYHGAEPCRMGHIAFARAIESAILAAKEQA